MNNPSKQKGYQFTDKGKGYAKQGQQQDEGEIQLPGRNKNPNKNNPNNPTGRMGKGSQKDQQNQSRGQDEETSELDVDGLAGKFGLEDEDVETGEELGPGGEKEQNIQ